MSPNVTPERIMQISNGHWEASTLATAATFRLFTLLEEGRNTPESVAEGAGIPPRSARALLDGVVGLGLATVSDGRYANTPEASAFLVEGKPGNLTLHARNILREFGDVWGRLPEAVEAGAPPKPPVEEVEENPFWEDLVRGIAPLTIQAARLAADRLRFAEAGDANVLDVGGGSGVFVQTLLQANPKAKGVHLDWANVNRIAREFAEQAGVADRFETIDGNFRSTDLGESAYDVIVYSHIAHQETPETNRKVFSRFYAALKPGGRLVVNDFIVADDRSGPPFPLLFSLNMLVHTRGGATYRRADYREWLGEAGFSEIEVLEIGRPASLVTARK